MENERIHIEQLEQAINAWRNLRPSTTGDARLCREAHILAEPYAMMIMGRLEHIAVADLSVAQRAALAAQPT